MSYSVVIPTNRSFHHIEPLLFSLKKQTFVIWQLVIVLDRSLGIEEREEYVHSVKKLFTSFKTIQIDIISHHNDKQFHIWKWASYVRNYGRKQVTFPDMMFVDDDNVFDDDFAMKAFEYRQKDSIIWLPKQWIIISPLQYDDTNSYVRQAVASRFDYMLCRPRRLTHQLLETTDRYHPLLLSSSNCLIGPTVVFQKFPFDETVPFVYEDLIMTGQMTKAWVKLYCDTRLPIIHAHGMRSKIASLYVHTPLRAYYKWKHRIILVHTIWSTRDIVLFYLVGLIGQTGWLVLHILLWAPAREWFALIWWLLRGTFAGIKEVYQQ